MYMEMHCVVPEPGQMKQIHLGPAGPPILPGGGMQSQCNEYYTRWHELCMLVPEEV